MHTKFKKLVDDICRQENLNHSNLSEFIYKSRNYIGRLYRDGSSDENIEKAIMLLERLNIKIEPTELDIVKAENEMLRKQDSCRVQVLDKRNDLLENARFENEQLENTVKHLQSVLNERTGELGKAKEHIDLNKKLFNELKKTEELAVDMDKTIKHQSSVIRGNNATIESLRGSGREVDYWIDKCERQYKINAFIGWFVLPLLLIVIGVVWFK